MSSFEAQVDAWVRKSERRMEAIRKEAAQRVIQEALRPVGEGGRMRVDTGFLRASGQISTASMPRIDLAATPSEEATYTVDEGAIAAVIAGADAEDTIYFGFTASYAAAREYGARGQAPDAFVRGAADQWQTIVRTVTAEAKARFP
ncbi:MAG: HK97 gp10 family phage protein [Myxococcota bacterium]